MGQTNSNVLLDTEDTVVYTAPPPVSPPVPPPVSPPVTSSAQTATPPATQLDPPQKTTPCQNQNQNQNREGVTKNTSPPYHCKLVSRKHPTLYIAKPVQIQSAHHTTFAYFNLPRACVLSDYDVLVLVCEAREGVSLRVSATFPTSAVKYDKCVKHHRVSYIQCRACLNDTSTTRDTSQASQGTLLLRTLQTASDVAWLRKRGVEVDQDGVSNGRNGGRVSTGNHDVQVSYWTQELRTWVVVWERMTE